MKSFRGFILALVLLSLFTLMLFSSCERVKPYEPLGACTLSLLQSSFERQNTVANPNEGIPYFISHEVSLGRIEPLWIATRASSGYSIDE